MHAHTRTLSRTHKHTHTPTAHTETEPCFLNGLTHVHVHTHEDTHMSHHVFGHQMQMSHHYISAINDATTLGTEEEAEVMDASTLLA